MGHTAVPKSILFTYYNGNRLFLLSKFKDPLSFSRRSLIKNSSSTQDDSFILSYINYVLIIFLEV